MRNPGWIDLQVNGCSGIDFSSPELTGDDFLRAAERVLESGTGCFLPTLITSPFGLYRRNLGVIRRAVVRHGLEREVPGVHLEGPFISADPGAAGRTTRTGSCRRIPKKSKRCSIWSRVS